MIFFALMTFINIPIYVFLWGKTSVVKLDINSFFAQLSLGSLELDMQSCSEQNMAVSTYMQTNTVSCISAFSSHKTLLSAGIALNTGSTCNKIMQNNITAYNYF